MVVAASYEGMHTALRLVDRLPQNTQEAAYEAALETLATRVDPDVFGAWLNEQPPDPSLDRPISKFAVNLTRMDPESAIAWADTIASKDLRYSTLDQIFRKWSDAESDLVVSRLQMLESAEDRERVSANLVHRRIREISAIARRHLDENQLEQVDLGKFDGIADQRRWIAEIMGVSLDGIMLGSEPASYRFKTKYGRSFECRF